MSTPGRVQAVLEKSRDSVIGDLVFTYFMSGVGCAQGGVSAGYLTLTEVCDRSPFEAITTLYWLAKILEEAEVDDVITCADVVEYACQPQFDFIAW